MGIVVVHSIVVVVVVVVVVVKSAKHADRDRYKKKSARDLSNKHCVNT